MKRFSIVISYLAFYHSRKIIVQRKIGLSIPSLSPFKLFTNTLCHILFQCNVWLTVNVFETTHILSKVEQENKITYTANKEAWTITECKK